jgi:hypothetical protein
MTVIATSTSWPEVLITCAVILVVGGVLKLARRRR